MKLFFLMEHLYPVVGGAERSMTTLLESLARRPGVEVSYMCRSNFEPQRLQEIADVDAVVTQLTWANDAIKAAKTFGKKSIFFVRSYEAICNVAHNAEILSHCGQRCSTCPHRRALPIIPDLIVANSLYTKRFLEREHGLSSEVLYPFLDFDAVRAPRAKRTVITMNQLAYHKGADIFLRVAARLPQYQFRIAGYHCWNPTVPVPSNVSLTGPSDPKVFYADTMLFLAPARWNETFGRTLLEARLNSIPVIASARGAAKEDGLVLPELLVEDIDDIDAWVAKIQKVLREYPRYVEAVEDFDFSPYLLERNVSEFLAMAAAIIGERPSPSVSLGQ